MPAAIAMAIAIALSAVLVLLPAFFFSVFSGCGVVSTASPGLFNHGGLILLFRHYGFQC